MPVQSGQTIAFEFGTTDPATGNGRNADNPPTGTLVISGVDNGATVTITNKAAGRYKASVTLPTILPTDRVQVVITATVAGVTDSKPKFDDGGILYKSVSNVGKSIVNYDGPA